MKLLVAVLVLMNFRAAAQTHTETGALLPGGAYDNIYLQPLQSDSNVSGFVIWIKQEVKPHLHATHSENVFILEGAGKMLLGGKTIEVKAGDLIYIPPQTVHALRVTSATPMKVLSIQAPEFDGKDRLFVDLAW
ncbi:MAG: cupin domain-containing protein [Chitinophagales bacterium]|nr:cupin domain-containing protein [Chitinophagales bacterium]